MNGLELEEYQQPLTKQQLIDRQQNYETVFNKFEEKHYIRDMQYCSCFHQGCQLCSGRGWRHTEKSMAFGYGLNASSISLNPYDRYTTKELHISWHLGKGTRAKAEIKRIREQFGIETETTENEQ